MPFNYCKASKKYSFALLQLKRTQELDLYLLQDLIVPNASV